MRLKYAWGRFRQGNNYLGIGGEEHMMRDAVVRMNGFIPLELPDGTTVEAEFKILDAGNIVLEFQAIKFAKRMVIDGMDTNWAALRLDYITVPSVRNKEG